MKFNFNRERYCHKCHRVREDKEFVKKPPLFRIAGICKSCK